MAATGMKPVVVGVDGTIGGIAAVDLAADEAMARVVPLVVVHAVQPPVDHTHRQSQRLLDLAVSRAQADHPGLAVSAELIRGRPLESLVRRADDGCLLVVGHARGDAASLAVQVAEHATVPVIVHRWVAPRPGPGRGPVTVGVGSSDQAGAAVWFAFEEALLRGAPVSAVYLGGGDDPDTAPRMIAAMRSRFRRYANVPVSGAILEGRPTAAALAAAAHGADLVVVSAHYQGPPDGPGEQISRALIDLALCPVAIVADRMVDDRDGQPA